MDHWNPWNPFGHPDPEYAGHAYFHPSLEGVTALTAFLALLLAALLVLRITHRWRRRIERWLAAAWAWWVERMEAGLRPWL